MRAGSRRIRSTFLTTAVILSLLVIGVLGCRSLSSSASAPSTDTPPGGRLGLGGSGRLPDGATAFDVEYPGVGRLDPQLLGAVRRASTDAADDGVELTITSGWRSASYQEQLLRDAVEEYGSEEEAARWVSTPETSLHVSGDAVDIGPSEAAEWLAERGAAYGLCQIYDNEPWHYELRPEAAYLGCPPTYDDPTEDPRMQQ